MRNRLKTVLAMLLLLVVCGAGSQAAVCELSCGLDAKGAACHMAAGAQSAEVEAMPHSHCSPVMQADSKTDRVSISGLHQPRCGHTLSLAVEDRAVWKAHFAVEQSALLPVAFAGQLAPQQSGLPVRRAPPLLAAGSRLLISLRV